MKETEVLISGGGIPGLSLALSLAQRGLKVAVIDPAMPKGAPQSGRTAALMTGAADFLKSIGAWDDIAPQTAPLKTLNIIDTHRDHLAVPFSAADIGREAFGYNTPNATFRAMLYQRAEAEENITLFVPNTLRDYYIKGAFVIARLDDETDIKASVLIGADGRGSAVRKIAGIDIKERDYGQSAITCLIDHSRDHNFISHEFHYPGGPFTAVPLPGKRSSIVWMEETGDADTLMHLKKQDFVTALQRKTANLLGEATLATPPECCPIIMQKTAALVAPRVALMAEAAHVISPIGAQGMNLSLRDAQALSDTLITAARNGEDIGARSVLTRYEQARKTDMNLRVGATDLLNRMVQSPGPFTRSAHRAGLQLLQHSPGVKNILMQNGLAA